MDELDVLLMKLHEKLMLAVWMIPLAITIALTIWAGINWGAEAGIIASIFGLLVIGGLDGIGLGFWAVFKKWMEADRRKAEEFDRMNESARPNTENKTPDRTR